MYSHFNDLRFTTTFNHALLLYALEFIAVIAVLFTIIRRYIQ